MAAGFLDPFLARLRRPRVSPTQTIGAPGVRIIGGMIDSDERSAELADRRKYKTYSDMLVNTSIVAAGVRYYLNLIAKARWQFEPSEADTTAKFAEAAEQMLTEDPITPWHRIVRRAGMYRFYGFSVQEWTARKDDEGRLTMKDIAPRAQMTIERWDVDDEGQVIGIIQRNPQTMRDIYLPRQKVVYMVDDTLNDSPEGLGIFRQMVESNKRLTRYEQLEGFGFETDLRGIPIGRAPFAKLAEMQEDGILTDVQREAIEAPLRDFITKHIKTSNLGLLLDSITYTTEDDKGTPSAQRQYDVELLKGGNTTQESVANAINRVNHELARIMGVEGLLLGGDKVGSLALSADKSRNLFLLIDGALIEIAEQFDRDLLDTIWTLNGWDDDLKPTMRHEQVQFKDVEQITEALRDMSVAGAILDPNDPVIGEVRDLLGLSRPLVVDSDLDASLLGTRPGATQTDEDAIDEDD